MTLDISNFYLMTPLTCLEYLRMKLRDVPAEIIQEYKLKSLVEPYGSVYILVFWHVCTTASRPLGKQTPQKMPQHAWILPK
ncbi:hypothetical protein ACHAW6_012200 [Cyclotella cf. meneghiniana]